MNATCAKLWLPSTLDSLGVVLSRKKSLRLPFTSTPSIPQDFSCHTPLQRDNDPV